MISLRTRGGDSHREKLTSLDAVRGVAALVVFSGHYFRNFAPEFEKSLNGTIVYTLLNGPAAVILFFVLSGFVLSRSPILAQKASGIVIAAIKRWPRLAGPVVASSFVYILGALSGAFPRPDQVLSGGEKALTIIYWGFGRHAENFPPVLREAVFKTFLHGSARYNDVLWSMHWEFIGSFLALAMALIICLRLPSIVQFTILAVIAVAATAYHPYLSCFAVGVLFCLVHEKFGRGRTMANGVAILLSLLAAVLFSYSVIEPSGPWAWVAQFPAGTQLYLWIGLQTIASVSALSVALYNPNIRSLLSGWVGSLLGRMSFPIYLLHLFVLWSFTSWMCVLAGAMVPPLWLVVLLYPATATVLFLIAYPLMRFDGWWVKTLNAASLQTQQTINNRWRRHALIAGQAIR